MKAAEIRRAYADSREANYEITSYLQTISEQLYQQNLLLCELLEILSGKERSSDDYS
jgi:hypothetical protein